LAAVADVLRASGVEFGKTELRRQDRVCHADQMRAACAALSAKSPASVATSTPTKPRAQPMGAADERS
jgi:hypothetical protein